MSKVGVLIVTFNRLKLLQEELTSIRKQSYQDFDIIVVNNCSTDGTKEWLSDQDDIHSIDISPNNIGPAAAFSLGMKYIAEQGYNLCWLMDDDVECYPNSLEELMTAYAKKEGIGFLCSKVVGLKGEPMNMPIVDERPSFNGYPDYADLLTEQMLKVKRCTFVSMLIPCYLINEIGLPYKEFYNWGVDSEYSLRLAQNHDCYMVNKSVVIHKRIIQGNLDFNTEKDPVRIAYYRSAFRNNDYIIVKFSDNPKKAKIVRFVLACINSINLFCHGSFRQSTVVLQAAFDLLVFNPKIEYTNS